MVTFLIWMQLILALIQLLKLLLQLLNKVSFSFGSLRGLSI